MLIDCLRSAKVAVPAGISLVVSGLLLILVSITLRYLHVASFAQPSQVGDFFRGFLVGVGIALEIGGIMVMIPPVLAAFEQRSERASSHNA